VKGIALVLTAALAVEQPVFRAGVDAVRVDVLVLRSGRPVGGLTTRDFELRDDGVVQEIDVLALEEVPLNLMLVLDTSFSVRGAPLSHLKDAAHAAVSVLGPSDRAALITFSHLIERRMPFSSDAASIHAAIDAVEAEGSTALTDATFAALEQQPDGIGRTLVLVFTDGIDTASWLGPLTVIDHARRSDAVVNAVLLETEDRAVVFRRRTRGLQPSAAQRRRWFLEEPDLFREEFLPAIADETGGDFLVANRGDDLRAAFVRIVSSFKSRYVLTFTPRGVPSHGWHPLDVRVKNTKADVRARRGYMR
jgi:VWFA-related protein